MTIRRLNPKKQGEIGIAVAISWFVAESYVVSIPLVDSQRYDLVVERDGLLQRVQVKTTTQIRGNRYMVELRTMGGNRSRQSIKLLDAADADLLFVHAGDGTNYLIPVEELNQRRMLSLGPQALKYVVFKAS